VISDAVALSLFGRARATQDLEILLEPTEASVERLKTALRSVFDDPHIDEITAEVSLGDCSPGQYVPPEGALRIDVLTCRGEYSKPRTPLSGG
jgi:hypothetical protein